MVNMSRQEKAGVWLSRPDSGSKVAGGRYYDFRIF